MLLLNIHLYENYFLRFAYETIIKTTLVFLTTFALKGTVSDKNLSNFFHHKKKEEKQNMFFAP